MSGFHRCVTCGTKLPANDPHEDCVSCLGPEHAASALADRAFCTSCASFQTCTLRRRARRAVGDHSPSSGSSHTLAALQSSLASPPVKLPLSRSSSSQLSAGQRSPDARRKRDRSHSPPVVRGPSPRGDRPRRVSKSRSRSPRRRGRSRSPRRDRRGGVTELTNKMSQFMDLMMGRQSLLMSLATARAADEPVGPVANQPMVLPQPFEAGLASFPPVGAAFAALVGTPTLSGLAKDSACPNKQCRITEVHLKRGYSAATEAVRLSNLASLLLVYQAALVKDLPDYPSVSLRTELGLIAQLLVKLDQLNARAQGRSIASLVVARRQLWLSQARV
ncbi:UNVERIFIED_CONTAM: hypothetical protein FKN15_045220 [Acipenser sinensis]